MGVEKMKTIKNNFANICIGCLNYGIKRRIDKIVIMGCIKRKKPNINGTCKYRKQKKYE